LPVFIGHTGATQLEANFSYDASFLYVFAKVKDSQVTNTNTISESDGFNLYLDPKNRNLIAPGKSNFKLELGQTALFSISEGENSKWKKMQNPQGVVINVAKTANGYQVETKIPWAILGEMPAKETRLGYNIELRERGFANYTENISGSTNGQPYLWPTLKLS